MADMAVEFKNTRKWKKFRKDAATGRLQKKLAKAFEGGWSPHCDAVREACQAAEGALFSSDARGAWGPLSERYQ